MLNTTSQTRRRRSLSRARRILVPVAAAAVVGTASLTGVGTASAHVSANAPTLTQGGYGIVSLVVPNEEDVPTVSVRVALPNLAGARTEAMPGWTSKVITDPATEKITAVEWTADPAHGIQVGQFAEFRVSGGPFPEQEMVALPAVQTYANGARVNWSQPDNADGSEPDHPAPTLTLPASSEGGHHGAAASSEDASTSDTAARWLGGVGLAVGALGAVIGVTALARRRKDAGARRASDA